MPNEPTTVGTISEEERTRRIEAAIHGRLDQIAAAHENKILDGVAAMIARHEQPDRSRVPELVNPSGDVVTRVELSPYYQRLPKDERSYRNPQIDHWHRQWLWSFMRQDHAGLHQADGKIRALYPTLYARADTLEGAADTTGGFAAGTGGVLLPRPLESLVGVALARIAKMGRWARLYVMTAQEHNVPTAGAATAYMQGEATSPLTGGEPALAEVPLVCHNAIGKLILGRDFMDDAAANVVPIFVDLMGEAIGALEDAEFLRLGTGTAPHPTKLAGLAYAEISSAELKVRDVLAMYSAVPQRYRTNARWLINGTVLGYMRNVRDGFGRPYYQSLFDAPMALGDDEGGEGTLLGKPVHEVDLTAGDLYFGDVGRNYAIGRRSGISVEFSRDFLFDTMRVIWLVRERIAGNNVDTTAGVLCVGITSATSL